MNVSNAPVHRDRLLISERLLTILHELSPKQTDIMPHIIRTRLFRRPSLAFVALTMAAGSCTAPKAQSNRSLVSFDGTVVKKGWTKSFESWDAGGSEYYVLEADESSIVAEGMSRKLILRPSNSVSFEEFGRFVGRRVQVAGEILEPQPYVPRDPAEPYPSDLDGRPRNRGSGLRVHEIRLLPKPQSNR